MSDYIHKVPLNDNISSIEVSEPIIKQQKIDTKSKVKSDRDDCGIIWSIYGLLCCG
jgi:hypothetical protein